MWWGVTGNKNPSNSTEQLRPLSIRMFERIIFPLHPPFLSSALPSEHTIKAVSLIQSDCPSSFPYLTHISGSPVGSLRFPLIRIERVCDLQDTSTDHLSPVLHLHYSLTALWCNCFYLALSWEKKAEHQTSPLRYSSRLMEHLKPGIALGRCQMGCCYRRHLMPEGGRPLRA